LDGKIYVIEQHDFDNMENHYPEYQKIYGYTSLKSRANVMVSELDKKKKYKGWDGKFYPQYKIIEVDEI
jgi:hypothetical protein